MSGRRTSRRTLGEGREGKSRARGRGRRGVSILDFGVHSRSQRAQGSSTASRATAAVSSRDFAPRSQACVLCRPDLAHGCVALFLLRVVLSVVSGLVVLFVWWRGCSPAGWLAGCWWMRRLGRRGWRGPEAGGAADTRRRTVTRRRPQRRDGGWMGSAVGPLLDGGVLAWGSWCDARPKSKLRPERGENTEASNEQTNAAKLISNTPST